MDQFTVASSWEQMMLLLISNTGIRKGQVHQVVAADLFSSEISIYNVSAVYSSYFSILRTSFYM